MWGRSTSPGDPRPLATASAIFLILFSLYTLTYQGQFRVDDEHILAARAQSLALWGELEQPQVFGNLRERELQAMGQAATQIEPGQAWIGAVLYRTAMGLRLGGAQALFMQNALLTAATASILVLSVQVLGFAPGVSAIVGLLFGLGTYAWPYATTYFRDPQAMLGAALALHGWVQASRRPTQGSVGAWIVLSFGAALGVTAKNAAVVLLPAFGAALSMESRRISVAARKRWLAWSAGALMVGLILLIVPKPDSLSRFTLDYYWSVGRHFLRGMSLGTLVEGVVGPFVSPGRSLILFCPPLLLMAAVPRRWWRQEASTAVAVLVTAFGLALIQVLFYREQWAGAVGWGPRPMLLALPGLMLLTAPAVQRLATELRGRWLLLGLGCLAAAVQLSAVLIPWQAAYESIRALGLEPYAFTGAWDMRRLLPMHQIAWLPRLEAWDLVWTRLALAGLTDWRLPVVAAIAGAVVGSAMLLRASRGSWLSMLGVGCALPVLLVIAAGSMRHDPAWFTDLQELRQAQDYVEARLEPADVVVVKAYGTPLWDAMMTGWRSPVRWYALPFEMPGTEGVDVQGEPGHDTLLLLNYLALNYERLWIMESSEAPDFSEHRETDWLRKEFEVLEQSELDGETRVVVTLIALNSGQQGVVLPFELAPHCGREEHSQGRPNSLSAEWVMRAERRRNQGDVYA